MRKVKQIFKQNTCQGLSVSLNLATKKWQQVDLNRRPKAYEARLWEVLSFWQTLSTTVRLLDGLISFPRRLP